MWSTLSLVICNFLNHLIKIEESLRICSRVAIPSANFIEGVRVAKKISITSFQSRGDHPTKFFLIVSPISFYWKKWIGIGPRSFETVVLARFWLKIWGVLGCFRGLEWPKWKKPTFNIKTFWVQGTKEAYFLHFGPSKPLKQPKTTQNFESKSCQNHCFKWPGINANWFLSGAIHIVRTQAGGGGSAIVISTFI